MHRSTTDLQLIHMKTKMELQVFLLPLNEVTICVFGAVKSVDLGIHSSFALLNPSRVK